MDMLSVKDLVQKGRDSFDRGEYKKASVLFNEAIEGDAKCVDAYFYLANIFHIKGDIGKAIKAFRRVLDLDPTHTDASISLSVLYNDIGHYEDAKKIFEKANERVKIQNTDIDGIEDKHINKKFSLKHLEIADLYLTYNRYDEALFEYNKVIALDPSNLEARIKVAKVYAKKGFTQKAFEELRTLRNEKPDYMPARISLGVLYYGTGKILEAQTEWERVLSKEPTHSEAAMYINLSKTATETTL